MLKVALIWFTLDVIAVLMVLYDYRKWYGHNETTPDVEENVATPVDSSPPFAA